MNILEIRNLRKSYKDLTAVNDLSFSVEKGEIHGILGIVTPDSGKVVFDGKDNLKKWKSNIGYVPQELAIYDELTAEENIRFFCSLYKFSSADVKAKVEKALDFVGLTDVRNKKAGTFSGGMKRRLNMACAIVHEPKLIIMDEPTVGIDPQSRNRILENVKKLNEAGATILYTTHYMPEVEEICSKLTVIDHGKIIASGTKRDIITMIGKDVLLTVEFKDNGGDLSGFVNEISACSGVTNVKVEDNSAKITHPEDAAVIDKIISAALSNGLTIVNIKSEEPSLDEIFLTLTGKDLRDRA